MKSIVFNKTVKKEKKIYKKVKNMNLWTNFLKRNIIYFSEMREDNHEIEQRASRENL